MVQLSKSTIDSLVLAVGLVCGEIGWMELFVGRLHW